MPKLVPGVNDLATLSPDVAAEADGWEPSTLLTGSNKETSWKCKEGHTWKTTLSHRTVEQTGCPGCAENGHLHLPVSEVPF